jgi:hypothetical protein
LDDRDHQAFHQPACGIPFTRSLRVEWRKSVDTRRPLAACLDGPPNSGRGRALVRAEDSPQTLPVYLATVSLAVTLLLPVVSILSLTAEWSQRTVLTTFTQEPRRARVLGAKLGAGLGLAVLGGAVGFLLAAGGLALSDAVGRDVAWDLAPKEVVGYAVFVLLSSLMGMAFGVLLHNTAAAIVLYFALPTLMTIVAVALKGVRDWVDTTRTLAGCCRSGRTRAQILTSLRLGPAAPRVRVGAYVAPGGALTRDDRPQWSGEDRLLRLAWFRAENPPNVEVDLASRGAWYDSATGEQRADGGLVARPTMRAPSQALIRVRPPPRAGCRWRDSATTGSALIRSAAAFPLQVGQRAAAETPSRRPIQPATDPRTPSPRS